MYARAVTHGDKSETVTLAVSGKLWHRSLVMVDSETGSLWSHILGEAMAGPLKGARLPLLPGLMTDWKTWRTRHPETTVVTLSRTSREFRREFYRHPENFVIGLAEGKEHRSWAFDALLENPVVNDEFRGDPLVVVFDDATSTAFLYDRRVAGETLEFEASGDDFVDTSTGSEWDPATGKCEAGAHAGKVLRLIPGIVSFRRVWDAFHPSDAKSATP